MKNQKLRSFAVMAAAIIFALALASCGGKGKLTITGIGDEYKGCSIEGMEISGDYIFAASATDIDAYTGATIKKATVTLNTYELTDDDTFVPFAGEATILRGRLIISIEEDDTIVSFINNKVVNLEKGSGKINLATDFELFD